MGREISTKLSLVGVAGHDIYTKLGLVGVHISSNEVLFHVLHGLIFEYNIISSALLSLKTTKIFQEIHDKLTEFEAHLTRWSSQIVAPIIANFATKLPAYTNPNSNQGTNNSLSNQRNFVSFQLKWKWRLLSMSF